MSNCVYQCAKSHGIQITRPWHNLHKNEVFAPKLKNQYSPRLPMYYFVGPSREQHILSPKIKIFSLHPERNNPWIVFVKGNIRENPLTNTVLPPTHKELPREQQAAHKGRTAYTRDQGRWTPRRSPRRGHMPTETPFCLSLELSSGTASKAPRRTCPYSGHNNKPFFGTCPFHNA